MSKTRTSAKSHFMASFQVRAGAMSESALTSGEGSIAIAMLRSGMFALIAQNTVQQKGVS